MFIMKICETNLDVLRALNGGVIPAFELDENGSTKLTYLVVQGGYQNQIIDHKELMELKKTYNVTSTTRKFYFTS